MLSLDSGSAHQGHGSDGIPWWDEHLFAPRCFFGWSVSYFRLWPGARQPGSTRFNPLTLSNCCCGPCCICSSDLIGLGSHTHTRTHTHTHTRTRTHTHTPLRPRVPHSIASRATPQPVSIRSPCAIFQFFVAVLLIHSFTIYSGLRWSWATFSGQHDCADSSHFNLCDCFLLEFVCTRRSGTLRLDAWFWGQ